MLRPFTEYRAARLRALQQERRLRYLVPLLAAAGLTFGLYVGSAGAGENWSFPLALAILGPIAYIAHRIRRSAALARAEFFADWADEHGFTYTAHPVQRRGARFLRKGHDQRFVEAFCGERDGVAVEVANFRYEEGSGRSERTIELLVGCVDCVLAGIEHLAVEPRGAFSAGVFDALEGAFTADRFVDLESAEFADRFRLLVNDGADDLAVRRVFTPKAITGLLDLGDARFEVAGGSIYIWELKHFDPSSLERVGEILDRALDLRGRLVSA